MAKSSNPEKDMNVNEVIGNIIINLPVFKNSNEIKLTELFAIVRNLKDIPVNIKSPEKLKTILMMNSKRFRMELGKVYLKPPPKLPSKSTSQNLNGNLGISKAIPSDPLNEIKRAPDLKPPNVITTNSGFPPPVRPFNHVPLSTWEEGGMLKNLEKEILNSSNLIFQNPAAGDPQRPHPGISQHPPPLNPLSRPSMPQHPPGIHHRPQHSPHPQGFPQHSPAGIIPQHPPPGIIPQHHPQGISQPPPFLSRPTLRQDFPQQNSIQNDMPFNQPPFFPRGMPPQFIPSFNKPPSNPMQMNPTFRPSNPPIRPPSNPPPINTHSDSLSIRSSPNEPPIPSTSTPSSIKEPPKESTTPPPSDLSPSNPPPSSSNPPDTDSTSKSTSLSSPISNSSAPSSLANGAHGPPKSNQLCNGTEFIILFEMRGVDLAVKHLLSCAFVALDCVRAEPNQEARLCLISLATHSRVYIFDLISMNKRTFDHATKMLEKILSNKKRIVKITYDCRKNSYSLYKQFNIRLENVFDTQAAYFKMLKSQSKSSSSFYSSSNSTTSPALYPSISTLLKKYCHDSESKLQEDKSMEPSPSPSSSTAVASASAAVNDDDADGVIPFQWMVRPMTKEMIEFASKNLTNLFIIREGILLDLSNLAEKECFEEGERYASAYIDKKEEEVRNENGNLLPVSTRFMMFNSEYELVPTDDLSEEERDEKDGKSKGKDIGEVDGYDGKTEAEEEQEGQEEENEEEKEEKKEKEEEEELRTNENGNITHKEEEEKEGIEKEKEKEKNEKKEKSRKRIVLNTVTDAQSVLRLLPSIVYTELMKEGEDTEEQDQEEEGEGEEDELNNLKELILDLGLPPVSYFFPSQEKPMAKDSYVLTKKDMDAILSRLPSFKNGNRIGVNGTLHHVYAIRNRNDDIIGLTFRLRRAIIGCADLFLDFLKPRQGGNILFLGPNGSGKSTVLRDVARILSQNQKVMIIDSFGEIGGDGNIPHFSVGKARRMQVKSIYDQDNVIMECVQNHNPQILIIDEIQRLEEVNAIRCIMERGVRVIAGIHGHMHQVLQNSILLEIAGGFRSLQQSYRQQNSIFDTIIELNFKNVHSAAICNNVEEMSDASLQNLPYRVQIRKLDESTGQICVRTELRSP